NHHLEICRRCRGWPEEVPRFFRGGLGRAAGHFFDPQTSRPSADNERCREQRWWGPWGGPSMKRLALSLGLAATLLMLAPGMITAYGGSVQAAVFHFPVILSGANENPATGSPGTGTGFVDIDQDANTLHVSFSFSGLEGPTTLAHIHCCIAPPGNTGIATAVPFFPGFPTGVTSGSYDHVFDMSQASTWNPAFIAANGGTTTGAASALIRGALAGLAYLNVHTSAFPSGEIRAFLILQTPGPSSIPTLSGWALIAFAALLILSTFVYLRKRTA